MGTGTTISPATPRALSHPTKLPYPAGILSTVLNWQFLRTFLSHVLRRLVAGLRLLLVEAQMPHLLQRAGQEMLLRLELRLLLLLVLLLWLQALLVLQVCWVLWWLCKSWPPGSVKSWCTKGIWKGLVDQFKRALFRDVVFCNWFQLKTRIHSGG